MKRFFVFATAALMLFALVGCGPRTAKIADIPDLKKCYIEGSEEYSTFTVDLSEYVDTKGEEVTYVPSSTVGEGCAVSVEGDVLSATLFAEGEIGVNVEVRAGGRKAFTLSFTVFSYPCTRIACVGDSLTYGHTWHNESYPVYLQELLGDGVQVENFGYNGSAVTNRSEPSFRLKYDGLKEYTDSLGFEPDVVFLMLGSNDGFNWEGSAPTFDAEYRKLISSYLDGGADTVILMTAPPTLEGNAFNLPNDKIRDNVCPAQRAVAEDMGLPLLDMRRLLEAQEDLESLYRPGDRVHFSVAGAKLVAQYAADALKRV